MNKVVFLDRDGVINKYPGDKKYVTGWKQFRFLPRVKEALSRLHQAGYKIFVVSNQAGVNKGIFSRESLDRLTVNMLKEIEKTGGRIDEAYYCVHRPDENCSCRKPGSGLIKRAAKEHDIRIRGSFFIGDTMIDMRTARNAGCKSVLILSGKEKLSNRKHWDVQPDFIFPDLSQAASFIISSSGGHV